MAYKHLPKWLQGRTDPRTGKFVEFTPAERAARKQYVRAGIKQLRRYAKGFDASEGYSLTDLKNIHPSRVAKVLKYTPYINELRASPHVEVSATSRKMRKALEQRTAQQFIPKQKRYVVHVADPENTKVSVRQGRVSEIREVGGKAKIVQTFYPLPERAVSFDHIADMLEEEMLGEMPKRGHYVLETETHGPVRIQAPMEHGRLVREMRSEWTRYDYGNLQLDPHQSRHFASSVTGFRMVATTVEGVDVYARRAPTLRQKYLEHHREQKLEEFGRVQRRLKPDRSTRATGRRGRVK